jgi:hypothetical protein
MPEVIPFVLWSWVPVTLLLFWKLAPARASAVSLVGGWLVLPSARFADSVASNPFPFWIMPTCLPSDVWTTKARVISVAVLVGVMAFDARAWLRFRPSWFDLPILGWCLVPLASGMANGLSPRVSALNFFYQSLSWGVPYLVGRLYFSDPPGLTILARSIVGGGLVYVPFCLVENVTGPIFYRLAYGFHAYQSDGARRYLGFRPIVGLEHGNQLGTWMASSALVAVWLWRSGMPARFWKLPGWLVAGTLMTAAILTQSAGAVILLVLGLALVELVWRIDRKWPIIVLLALPLVFVVARAANLFDAKALAMGTSLGRQLADASVKLDRQSFGWRLRVEERAARVALERPVLGWGRWDWWREASTEERPWGLFSLVMGMDGVVGLLALIAAMALPIAAFLALGPPRFWINPSRAPAAALAFSLALNELDAILNSNFLLFYLAAAGGLVGLRDHAKAASAWIKRAQAGLK